MPLRRAFSALAFATVSFALVGAEPAEPPEVRSPLTPKEAQKLFHLPPGLRIELVA